MKNIFIPIIFIMLCVSGLTLAQSSNGQFQVKTLSCDSSGIIELQFEFHLDTACHLYQWQGEIYPMFNRALFVTALLPQNDSVRIETVEKYLPHTPSHNHLIVAKDYVYPVPLKVKILDKNGKAYKGCLKLKFTYDMNKLKPKVSYLSKIRVESNILSVCNK